MTESIWHITDWDITLRLLLSAVLGGMIGLEREWNQHAAGFRTHILVSLGAASIMLLSIYGFEAFAQEPGVRSDPARLAAQVISGIGFLGAGAILRTGSRISGLTTAASIWVVAAIGLSVGAGFWFPALLTTALVFISLFALNKWEKAFIRKSRSCGLLIKIPDKPGMLGRVTGQLEALGMHIKHIQAFPLEGGWEGDPALAIVELKLQIVSPVAGITGASLEKLSGLPDVLFLEIDGMTEPIRGFAAKRPALKS
ncbi:MgtC/SapB family protein [Paenibacillus sp. TAB 01]|uniref:MgtC/SapB family protein n=1 Tax=Paenibacillus sp. TAB 01 TaxID=3368988 RepID=UPI00374FDD58